MMHHQTCSTIVAALLAAFCVSCDGVVVDLIVIEGLHSACPEDYSKVSTGDDNGLTGNFNQGTLLGSYIWLCVKSGKDDPITDLTVVASTDEDQGCGNLKGDWHRVKQQQGSNGDFNHGVGGLPHEYVYLCYKKDPSKAGLANLAITAGDCASGTYRIPTDKDSNGDFNQKAGGKYIYLCFSRGCKATKVTGQWVTHGGQIASTGEESWTYGTDYTHSESETESWSNSVTKSVNLGFSFKGVTGGVDISGTISHEISLSYSYSWSTTTSDTYQVDFDKSMIGKQPWQFQFTPYDSCGHAEVSAAKALAITEGAYQPPCCLPGYAKDAPAYKTCVSADAMIPNGTAYGCTVAASAESSAVLV